VTFNAKHCQLTSVASLSHWASTSTFAMLQCVMRGLSATPDPCCLHQSIAETQHMDFTCNDKSLLREGRNFQSFGAEVSSSKATGIKPCKISIAYRR